MWYVGAEMKIMEMQSTKQSTSVCWLCTCMVKTKRNHYWNGSFTDTCIEGLVAIYYLRSTVIFNHVRRYIRKFLGIALIVANVC